MREGWEYIDFKDVFPIKMGKTPPRGDKTSWDVNKETQNKWVSIADISNNEGQIITDTKEYISDSAAKKIHKVAKGSLLMSFKLSIGRMAFAGDDLYTNEAIIAIPESEKYNIRFIYNYLLWYDWMSLTEGNEKVKGATLNKSSIGQIKLPVIPLSDQQSIVSYLDSSFSKIDAMKANASKALEEAKALFQATLKEMLEPKEGWEEKTLGEFAHMKAGEFVKASDIHAEYEEGLYPCYGGNGLRGYVSVPNQDGEYCLIGRQGALCGNVNLAKGIFRATEHAVVVKPYSKIPPLLTYYLLTHLNINQYATGAAQPGISVKNIEKAVKINVPPEIEWNSIVTTLDSLKSKVDQLQANYEKIVSECDALKQSILRQVFE